VGFDFSPFGLEMSVLWLEKWAMYGLGRISWTLREKYMKQG
jgi:hypothetical protein